MTNPTTTNAISVFNRFSDGTLAFVRTTPIGGEGSGNGLGSQGSLVLSPDRHWLFAVDAGSNQISVIAVGKSGDLQLRNVTNSGGLQPISLTYSHGYLYVLNASNQHNQANVTVFRVGTNGHLDNLVGSTQTLAGAAAEVQASPSGDQLIVTEKATNTIDSYKIGNDGRLSQPKSIPATNSIPFGFAFNPVSPQQFIVAAAESGGLISYQVQVNGKIKVLDGPVQDNQIAPCWAAVRQDGKFAYTTNAINGSISIYEVNPKDGKLNLDSTVSTTGATGPVRWLLLLTVASSMR